MPAETKWRGRAKRALERYFRERSVPRLILGNVLILTGLAGLLISYGLLHAGLRQMWLRYPIAVVASYGFLLALIRLWVEFERRRFDPEHIRLDQDDGLDAAARPNASSGESWLDGLDLSSGFDVSSSLDVGCDEGCFVVILLGVVVGLVVTLVVTIFGAPALLAEVFLDAFLVGALYRRLRVARREHWLGTAIRKTWRTALLVAFLLGLGGWCLERLAPGAESIGPALQRMRWAK